MHILWRNVLCLNLQFNVQLEYSSLELVLVTRIQPLHLKRFLVLCNIRTVASGLNARKRKSKEFTVNY
jgi:hypothetical protein